MEKHKHNKTETLLGETGVGQVEEGFVAESPMDVLAVAAAGPGVPPSQLRKQMAEVGIKVPEKPVKEKKPQESHHSGVDSIEDGFLAQPEMTPVEELGAIRYAAAPEEVQEGIEKVEGKQRLTLNEALLAKLREAGYTGDLEDLRKLAADLKE